MLSLNQTRYFEPFHMRLEPILYKYFFIQFVMAGEQGSWYISKQTYGDICTKTVKAKTTS